MIDWLFFGPARLIALWPLAGVAIALLLLTIQLMLSVRGGRMPGLGYFREAPVLAGLLWLIFGLYERQVDAVRLLSGDPTPPFRIDLLVLAPILYVLTAAAVYSIYRQWRNRAGGNERENS
jgi:hypothetical protein